MLHSDRPNTFGDGACTVQGKYLYLDTLAFIIFVVFLFILFFSRNDVCILVIGECVVVVGVVLQSFIDGDEDIASRCEI